MQEPVILGESVVVSVKHASSFNWAFVLLFLAITLIAIYFLYKNINFEEEEGDKDDDNDVACHQLDEAA